MVDANNYQDGLNKNKSKIEDVKEDARKAKDNSE